MLNRKGFALPFVIIVFAVLMIFGSLLLLTQLSEGKDAIRQEHYAEASYAAQASVHAILSAVTGDGELYEDILLDMYDTPIGDTLSADTISDFTVGNTAVNLTIERLSGTSYLIQSEARRMESTALARVTLTTVVDEYQVDFDNVVYAEDELDLDGMDIVEGDVQYGDDGTYTEPKNGTLTGDISNESVYFPEPIVPAPLVGVPLVDEYTAGASLQQAIDNDADGYLAALSINFGNNDQIIVDFDVLGHDVFIYVETLYLNSPTAPNIIIEGEGTLTIMVEQEATLKQFPKTDEPEDSHFLLMLRAGATANLTANNDGYGYIYGPNASVDMSTGNATFHGAIIAEDFNGDNGDLFYESFSLDIPINEFVMQGFDLHHWE